MHLFLQLLCLSPAHPLPLQGARLPLQLLIESSAQRKRRRTRGPPHGRPLAKLPSLQLLPLVVLELVVLQRVARTVQLLTATTAAQPALARRTMTITLTSTCTTSIVIMIMRRTTRRRTRIQRASVLLHRLLV